MFMDQNITLHARPTNIVDSHTRTMTRMISYLDRLYPGEGPADHVLFEGQKLDHEQFAALVDAARLEESHRQAAAKPAAPAPAAMTPA